jgi:hypothetical protein
MRWGAHGHAAGGYANEGRCSFLKKRTKKTILSLAALKKKAIRRVGFSPPSRNQKLKVFCFFFSKKKFFLFFLPAP